MCHSSAQSRRKYSLFTSIIHHEKQKISFFCTNFFFLYSNSLLFRRNLPHFFCNLPLRGCKKHLQIYMKALRPRKMHLQICKKALHPRKGHLQICMKALHPRKRHLQICKKALHPRKRHLQICKNVLHACKGFLQICMNVLHPRKGYITEIREILPCEKTSFAPHSEDFSPKRLAASGKNPTFAPPTPRRASLGERSAGGSYII